jgi:CubicO group peptidase (beta-lactamase class C family)
MAALLRIAVLTLCVAFLLVTCGGPLIDRLSPRQESPSVAGGAPGSLLAPPQAVSNGPIARATSGPAAPIAPPASAPAPTALSGEAQPLIGQMQPVGQPPSGVGEQIDSYLRSLAEQGFFSGSVLVAQSGAPLLSAGYSMANYEQSLPATPQTRYRLASVTKQFTAMGIMMLAARGKLSLNDSACAYIPDCPAAWGPITVQNLLNHTSGLPNYTDFADFATIETSQVTPDQLLNRFRYMPLGFTPGSLFQYCNSNYLLLALIIERVSGQSYGDFIQGAIFTPLGMANSGLDTGDGAPLGGTRGYAGVNVPAIAINASTLYGAGDLFSTVEDMYRWDQALYGEQLLPAQWREQMFTPGLQNFGYGWKISDWNGHRRIAHPGNMSGAATFIVRYPDDKLTIIVLSNNEWANTIGIADQIAALVLQ